MDQFLSIYELNHQEEMRCPNPLCIPGRGNELTGANQQPVITRSQIVTGRLLAQLRYQARREAVKNAG